MPDETCTMVCGCCGRMQKRKQPSHHTAAAGGAVAGAGGSGSVTGGGRAGGGVRGGRSGVDRRPSGKATRARAAWNSCSSFNNLKPPDDAACSGVYDMTPSSRGNRKIRHGCSSSSSLKPPGGAACLTRGCCCDLN